MDLKSFSHCRSGGPKRTAYPETHVALTPHLGAEVLFQVLASWSRAPLFLYLDRPFTSQRGQEIKIKAQEISRHWVPH